MAYLDHSNQGLVLSRPSALAAESFLLAGDPSATETFFSNNSLNGVLSVAMFGRNFPRYWINPRNAFTVAWRSQGGGGGVPFFYRPYLFWIWF